MADLEPWFIDANVPMYAAGAPSEYKAACIAILEAAASGKIVAVTDAEVIQEIAYRYWHIGKLAEALEIARDFAAAIPRVLPVDVQDAMAMLELLAAHPQLTPRDALHCAVMKRHGISRIITADRHFTTIPDIVCMDPRTFASQMKIK